MKITVNARKVFVNQKLTEHIEKKLAKFDKFFPGDAEAAVKLSRVRDVERVEVTIQSGATLFRSEDESSTFMNALGCCLYAIERQIRKNKTKLAKQLRDTSFADKFEDTPDEQTDYEVIKYKKFALKPMTVDEAILQMNMLGHGFFMFKNGETGAINVVYKRADENYAVLEPSDE